MANAKQRRRRFTLGTLFLLVTALCVFVGWKAARARAQRKAAEIFRRHSNGGVFFRHEAKKWPLDLDDGQPTWSYGFDTDRELKRPAWLSSWLGDEYFHSIVCGSSWGPLRLRDIKTLAALPELRWLDLTNAQLSEEHFAILGRMRRLRGLYLNHYDGGFPDTRGFQSLGRLRQLEALSVTGYPMTPEVVETLGRFDNLTHLELGGRGGRVDLTPFDGHARLRDLTISNSIVFDGDMELVVTMPKLRKLSAYHTRIGDPGIKLLAEKSSLAQLEVGSDQITDAALRHLVELKTLKELGHIRCFSAEALAEFRKARPDCKLYFLGTVF